MVFMTLNSIKVAGEANVSVGFFSHNMLGNIELNIDITNNHPALTSYFANPSFKKVLLEIPDFLETLSMFP